MMPTTAAIERLLATREVGARLAQGPWQRLPRGRWGVPAVGYLSGQAMPDLVLAGSGRGLAVERGRERGEVVPDPVGG